MYYRCDPRKNVHCKKRDCFIFCGICSLTSDEKCACDSRPNGIKGEISGTLIKEQDILQAEVIRKGPEAAGVVVYGV